MSATAMTPMQPAPGNTPNYYRRRQIGAILLYLLTIVIMLIIAFPMYWLITTSFKVPADATANPPIIIPTRFTLDNYVNAFKTAGVGRAFANSIIVATAATFFTTLLGAMLSLCMEILQASIAPRVPSLTDLSLNTLGAALGATAGSAWHLLGPRMAPQATPKGRSAAVAVTIVVLWLLARLWPLMPDASLRQLKRAVRPLFSPSIGWAEFAAYFVGWLVVAQAVFHLARRQRGVDAFLLVIAAVLVGRTFTAGHTLEFTELAAIALLLPVLVLLNRIEDRARCASLAALLGAWLAAVALWPAIVGGQHVTMGIPGLAHFSIANAPPPAELAGKGFSYVALTWLLAGAGLFPHVAAGVTVLLVLLLCMLQVGAAAPTYGWVDLVIAVVAGLVNRK